MQLRQLGLGDAGRVRESTLQTQTMFVCGMRVSMRTCAARNTAQDTQDAKDVNRGGTLSGTAAARHYYTRETDEHLQTEGEIVDRWVERIGRESEGARWEKEEGGWGVGGTSVVDHTWTWGLIRRRRGAEGETWTPPGFDSSAVVAHVACLCVCVCAFLAFAK